MQMYQLPFQDQYYQQYDLKMASMIEKDDNFASTPTFHAPYPMSTISQLLGLVLVLMKPANYLFL